MYNDHNPLNSWHNITLDCLYMHVCYITTCLYIKSAYMQFEIFVGHSVKGGNFA